MSRSSFARSLVRVASLLVLCSLLFQGQPAHAVQAIVARRYAKPVASGSGNCVSWADACTLQAALSGSFSGEIWVMQGTHTPGSASVNTFLLKNGVAVYGGFAGSETLLSQRNIAANVTILSGEIGAAGIADNSIHVVTGSGTNSSAVLDGFTVSGGNATGPVTTLDIFGGGMLNDGGSPTVANVTFSGNTAYQEGGGMANLSYSKPNLLNVTFTGNSAASGGGMSNGYSSSPVLVNVTFSANQASFGAGMNNYNSSPTLTNVTFSGNFAEAGGYGAGIYNGNGSNPILRNSILWGNSAVDGPQIYNIYASSPNIYDSVIQGGCPSGSICTSVSTDDPKLGPLGSYGGPNQTVPLLPGSSAIDLTSSNCPASDQRGVARGSTCDVGAFESRGFTLAQTSGSGQSAAVNAPFGLPLVVTLTETGGVSLPGAAITFNAPASGASATLSSPTATTDSSGIASVTATANNAVGSYEVTASAATGLSAAPFALTNIQADTITTLTSSANPSTQGRILTFTATVSSSGIPSGSVAFKYGGTIIPGCDAQALNGSGQAVCTIIPSTVGVFDMSAEYSGSASHNPSASLPYTQVVNENKVYLPAVQR